MEAEAGHRKREQLTPETGQWRRKSDTGNGRLEHRTPDTGNERVKRMSWVANRGTTSVSKRMYSLVYGLFIFETQSPLTAIPRRMHRISSDLRS